MMNSEKLEHYFLEVFPDIISEDEALSLLYVVADIRPGALIMSAQNIEIDTVREFCDLFGLESRFFHSSEEVFDTKGLFIARDEEAFKLLEESQGSFYGCSDLDVGKFLGYDMGAVKYYEENFKAGQEYREKLSELLDSNKLSEKETAYLNLVCYVPVPEENHILKAVARGKKRAQQLRKFDQENNTEVGRKYLEMLLDAESKEAHM